MPGSTDITGENVIRLNGQDYLFDVHLLNAEMIIRIPQPFIATLDIEDSLYSTFSSGRMIIKNVEDMIENFSNKSKGKDGIETVKSYNFASAGRDIVMVNIRPIAPGEIKGKGDSFPKEDWELGYIFSVVQEHSQHTDDPSVKFKILDLIDVREQLLEETVNHWSTNKALLEVVDNSINLSQKSNEDRSVLTGVAIKNFLKTTFDSLDIKSEFHPKWDKGATKIFYTAPSTAKAMSTLLELLDSHVSHINHDNCLLRAERNNVFSLRSYEDYFKLCLSKGKEENAPGAFISDIFSLPYQTGSTSQKSTATEDITITDQQYSTAPKASYPLGRADWTDFASVKGYSFANFSIVDSINELTTIPVHHINRTKKQFEIDIKDNQIKTVAEKFHELYTKKFHGANGADPVTIFPVSQNKDKHILINNTFSLNSNKKSRLKSGRNCLFNKAISFAPGLSFKIKGSTHRKAGRFMSILSTSREDTRFQNILQGEWFITHVLHHFENGKYENVVTGVKFYAHK